MRSGILRHRVELWGETRQANETGQKVPTPFLVGTYPAEVRELKGQERVIAKQSVAESTHQVTMRYGPTVTNGSWFLWDGRRLNVVHVATDVRKTELKILCLERKAPSS